jgi:hypothetical protein
VEPKEITTGGTTTMTMLTESEIRDFGDRLERWFNELQGGEQAFLREILTRAAAAARFLEGADSDYAQFDPSDLVYRCGTVRVSDLPRGGPAREGGRTAKEFETIQST